jgi:transcriptional regulator with XRE-family HTH domain
LGYLSSLSIRDNSFPGVAAMSRTSRSPRQARLQQLLIQGRVSAGLTQVEVARQLRRPQSFVSKYEAGERRLDVVELIDVAAVIGVDVVVLINQLRDELEA